MERRSRGRQRENIAAEEAWVKEGHFAQLGTRQEALHGDVLDEQVLPGDSVSRAHGWLVQGAWSHVGTYGNPVV